MRWCTFLRRLFRNRAGGASRRSRHVLACTPHAARALTGSGHRRLLPVTALAGAVFLVWVDTLARTVLDPQEVPVGVVTSLIGVPVFVLILHRTRRSA